MSEISEIELEYPELRLITEQHKMDFFNCIQNNSDIDRKAIKEKSDLVLKQIAKDIKFTGDDFTLFIVMNTHMVESMDEAMEVLFNLNI